MIAGLTLLILNVVDDLVIVVLWAVAIQGYRIHCSSCRSRTACAGSSTARASLAIVVAFQAELVCCIIVVTNLAVTFQSTNVFDSEAIRIAGQTLIGQNASLAIIVAFLA